MNAHSISEIFSEDDDDEDEEESKEKAEGPVVKREDGEPAAVEGEDNAPKKVAAKAESTELVEYSPDELQDVNKDILNADITQLEGECPCASNLRRLIFSSQRKRARRSPT